MMHIWVKREALKKLSNLSQQLCKKLSSHLEWWLIPNIKSGSNLDI